MSTALALSEINKLADDITDLYEKFRQSGVKFTLNTGRRIVETEQKGKVRAVQGLRVIPRLSIILTKRLGPGFSETSLKIARRLFLARQRGQPAALLSPTSQEVLLRVKDLKVRKQIARRAEKEHLSRRQVAKLVKKVTASHQGQGKKALPLLKRPTDLRLCTYSKYISSMDTRHWTLDTGDSKCLVSSVQCLDLGFFLIHPVTKDQLTHVTITDSPSFTYEALVERVIDGDTLILLIHAGFGEIVRLTIRLKGIDCPELATPEGEAAKRFNQKRLPVGSLVILKSHKCKKDNYGRFVADILYKTDSFDAQQIIKDGVYLNQELLDAGHAVRAEW